MIQEIDPKNAHELLNGDGNVAYLDVRTVKEFEDGHVPEALNIPIAEPDLQTGRLAMNPRFLETVQARLTKNRPIIVGCKSGGRSAQAVEIMQESGYTNVRNLRGGFVGAYDALGRLIEPGWAMLGLPVVTTESDGN